MFDARGLVDKLCWHKGNGRDFVGESKVGRIAVGCDSCLFACYQMLSVGMLREFFLSLTLDKFECGIAYGPIQNQLMPMHYQSVCVSYMTSA